MIDLLLSVFSGVAVVFERARRIIAPTLVLALVQVASGHASEHGTSTSETGSSEFPIIEDEGDLAEGGSGDFEGPPQTNYRLAPSLFFGSNFRTDFKYEENFDLDDSFADDLGQVDTTVNLAFAYVPSDKILAYLNFQLARDLDFIEEGRDRPRETDLNVSRAYITFKDVFDGVSLQFGRQNFEDDREWLFDESLDAARIRYRNGDFKLQMAAGRKTLVGRDLLNKDRKNRINTYIGFAEYEVFKHIEVAAFGVFREDRSERNGQPVIFGLRSLGEIDVFDDELSYWLHLAAVRGDDKGTDIEGHAADFGATYKFDVPFTPYLTLGYAFGSGDSDPGDGEDNEFRPTDLEDNSDKFGGVSSLKYYGELFDPELRNIHIVTAGIGLRPTKNTSIDFIYHMYRQDEFSKSDSGASTDLDPNEDPAAMSKSLGTEFNVVIGARDILPNVDIDFSFAYFIAGDAFRVEPTKDVFADADDAFFAGFEFEYRF